MFPAASTQQMRQISSEISRVVREQMLKMPFTNFAQVWCWLYRWSLALSTNLWLHYCPLPSLPLLFASLVPETQLLLNLNPSQGVWAQCCRMIDPSANLGWAWPSSDCWCFCSLNSPFLIGFGDIFKWQYHVPYTHSLSSFLSTSLNSFRAQ